MTDDEREALVKMAHGHGYVVCDSYNDVRRVRAWMSKNYPYIRLRVRSNERTGKIAVKAVVRR